MRTRFARPRSWILVAFLLAIAALSSPLGCASRHDTAAELEVQIARYRTEPSDALASRIDASFARLDADVAEIRADAETKTGAAKESALARADALEQRGAELRKSYFGARVDVAADAAKNAVKQFGSKVGEGLETAGETVKNALGGEPDPD
jgi:hypothetical protein